MRLIVPSTAAVAPVPVDSREATKIIIETLANLRDGKCIRCEQVCPDDPAMRNYVLQRLAVHPTVSIQDIGDGRLCLLYVAPEWLPLTLEAMRRLETDSWLASPNGALWTVSTAAGDCLIHGPNCIKIGHEGNPNNVETVKGIATGVEVYADHWHEISEGAENGEACLRADELNGWKWYRG